MRSILLEKTPTFDLKQTLDCGQVFRYKEREGVAGGGSEGRVFELYALDERAVVTEEEGGYKLQSDNCDFFYKYLDFDTNYDIIQLKTQDKGLVSSAIEFGKGIHILRQDAVETIFSFLISQNNHIPRIKGIIERMCEALGKDMGGYHAFPEIGALASAGEDFFKSIGAGYRAAYLDRTAKTLADADVEGLKSLDTESLRKELTNLHGVGRKVADCILLFGFNRFDVFPVDTWIKKVFEDSYPGVAADKLSVELVAKYGKYSGYVQQWLFYYKREQKNL